ncbi:MAG: cation:proton antiporter [Burkholderiales bacterium]
MSFDPQILFQQLPLIAKFAVIFGLIVILPRVAEHVGLPGVLGVLLGGVLLGPAVLGLLNPQGKAIELFAELGKLLLMFFAGYEINLSQLRRSGARAATFGVLTCVLPLSIGFGVARAFGYEANAAVLIGSLLASHTLLGLPIARQFGLLEREAVVMTIVATIITDISAMLILAVTVSVHTAGFSPAHLANTLVGIGIYVPVVVFGLSAFTRFIYARTRLPEVQLGVIIAMIAIAASLAETIELEGIVGAFLTGIAVKRAVGENPVTDSLRTISEALFIPTFFLATGFLVDFKLLAETLLRHAPLVAAIVGGLVLAKYLAARSAGMLFKIERDEVGLMWSLTLPQVAATLAAATVAYRAKDAQGATLIDEKMLNTVVVLVIATSILGPVLARRFGARISK